jgi:hypothetical protein
MRHLILRRFMCVRRSYRTNAALLPFMVTSNMLPPFLLRRDGNDLAHVELDWNMSVPSYRQVYARARDRGRHLRNW